MSAFAVEIEGLVKRYGSSMALDLSEIRLAAGRIHVIVGSNGAGKTTLLRILLGLEPADDGSASVLGTQLRGANTASLLELRRRTAMVTQRPYLFGTTAGANVEYPLRARGVSPDECRHRAEDAMDALGVRHLYDQHAQTTSAGEAQRIAIARSIVAKPKVAFFDEPVANIDPATRPVVEGILRKLCEDGATVVVATHVVDQAYRLSADVVRIEKGRVAPPAIENLIEGELVAEADGETTHLVLGGGLRLRVATDIRGSARAAIAPHDIIISKSAFDSSARNSLGGQVTRLEKIGTLVHVTMDVGIPLISSITAESCSKMHLTIGSNVVCTFKASAVTVF
jgi:molybdopterin-binding protein